MLKLQALTMMLMVAYVLQTESSAPHSSCAPFAWSVNFSTVIIESMSFLSSNVSCGNCTKDTPTSLWYDPMSGMPLLMEADAAEWDVYFSLHARQGFSFSSLMDSLTTSRSLWCLLRIPIPCGGNNSVSLSGLLGDVGHDASSSVMLLLDGSHCAANQTATIFTQISHGSVPESSTCVVQGISLTSSVVMTSPSAWNELLATLNGLRVLDVSGTNATIEYLPIMTIPTSLEVLRLERNLFSGYDIEALIDNAVCTSGLRYPLKWVDTSSCDLMGSVVALWVGRCAPALFSSVEYFNASANRFALQGLNVTTILSTLRNVRSKNATNTITLMMSNSGLGGTIVLPTQEGNIVSVNVTLSIDISQNCFSSLVLPCPPSIKNCSGVWSVDGVVSLALDNNTGGACPSPLLSVTIDGRNAGGLLDVFSTVRYLSALGTSINFGNSSIVVQRPSGKGLCSLERFACRVVDLRGAVSNSYGLALDYLDEQWERLDMSENWAFATVTQQCSDGFSPVLLSAQSCALLSPCCPLTASYTSCVCTTTSVPSANNPSDNPPIWERKQFWAIAAVVLAVLVLAVVAIAVYRRASSLGSNAQVSIVSSDDEELCTMNSNKHRWTAADEAQILCDANECQHIFSQYHILPVSLGDGSTAKVLEVVRRSDKKKFALKRYIFKAEDGVLQFGWMDLFKEYWLLRQVEHPNVIRIEEVFISFFDALLPEARDENLAGHRSSDQLLLNSSREFQDEHYPSERLVDSVTPFLRTFEHEDEVAARVKLNQAKARRYCYIVMPYIADGTLLNYFQRKKSQRNPNSRHDDSSTNWRADAVTPLLCEEEALTIALQLFRALEYLHDPHRRSHLMSRASGTGFSGDVAVSTSSLKPDALGNYEGNSAAVFDSSASFLRHAHEEDQSLEGGGGRGAFLTDDGPILHRDVKPDNILVEVLPGYQVGVHSKKKFPEVRVVLTDFGFSDIYQKGVKLAHKGAPVSYSAPEVSRGLPTPASDVFSAGIVTFEMLTATQRSVRNENGNFATSLGRQTFVDKQKQLLTNCEVRRETIELLFNDILVVQAQKRLSAKCIVERLKVLLGKP